MMKIIVNNFILIIYHYRKRRFDKFFFKIYYRENLLFSFLSRLLCYVVKMRIEERLSHLTHTLY